MTGYDRKSVTLTAAHDCEISLEIDVDHWTGFHPYKTFQLKAGETVDYAFPEGFSAHWVRAVCDAETLATVWFKYN